MNEVSVNIKSFAGLQSIDVGPLRIHWLAKQVPLAPETLEAELAPADLSGAATINAEARRLEYLRSRLVFRRISGWQGPLERSVEGVIAWPRGSVGSVTHKDGHVGVALESSRDFLTVGIDAEDVSRMRAEFAPRLACDREMALLADLARRSSRPLTSWLAVLFSFKEALFKSHFPLGRTMFYFLDAEIDQIAVDDAGNGTIRARVLVPTSPMSPAGSVWQGSYRFHTEADQQFVLTSAVVPQLT